MTTKGWTAVGVVTAAIIGGMALMPGVWKFTQNAVHAVDTINAAPAQITHLQVDFEALKEQSGQNFVLISSVKDDIERLNRQMNERMDDIQQRDAPFRISIPQTNSFTVGAK